MATTQPTALGLPAAITACLFDLDGVLTPTAALHQRAWKEMFDAFLSERGGPNLQTPFTSEDYNLYVDGKPRQEGIRSFLQSRGIELPERAGPGEDSLQSLGERKQAIVVRLLDTEGVTPYPGSVRFATEVRRAGLSSAVVSSSANCRRVLHAARIDGLFDAVVDGDVAARRKLAGKPAPDTFLEGARLLGVAPAAAAVFEDALAGVEAGRAGGFGYVVGVDRVHHAQALREHGADTVVSDLSELLR
jgi:beta-phosphoglucomutase family hydrolase